MNKKIIIFILVLSMCAFLCVGCKKQTTSSKPLPEGISKDVYDDAILSIQAIKKIGSPEESAKEQFEELRDICDRNSNGGLGFKSGLTSKEKKIVETIYEMWLNLELYIEDGRSLMWADDIVKCLDDLSTLLELDLEIIFEENKFTIEGI